MFLYTFKKAHTFMSEQNNQKPQISAVGGVFRSPADLRLDLALMPMYYFLRYSCSPVYALYLLFIGAGCEGPAWDQRPGIRKQPKPAFDEKAAEKLLAPLNSGRSVCVNYFQGVPIELTFYTDCRIDATAYDLNHGTNQALLALGKDGRISGS
jgi:hypothetical protein